MENINTFEKDFIKVRLTLTEETENALNASEYAHLLKTRDEENSLDYVDCAWLDMEIVFALYSGEVYFNLYTVTAYKDEPPFESGELNIELDPATAEYFKGQALKALAENFAKMNACKYEDVRITV